ncbi:MAG: GntR family transcriptional regulator [Oscillospiraceae bacterium]|nr:GntR family transcriptional regulator [Oscillospiraceae bacterium]
MSWELTADRPIYLQLIDHIKMNIISGEFAPGSKILSVRELASRACVNPNTMQRALSELEKLGLLYTQRTNGRFITENLDVIENARESFAKNHTKKFSDRMSQLGLSKAQIINLVEEFSEEDLQ